MSLILPSRTHHVLFYILEKTPLSLSLSFFLFPFFGPRGLTLDFTWTRCLETPDAKDGGRSGRVRQQQCHAVQKLLQGAAEAARVRSMQDPPTVPRTEVHTAHRKRGGLAIKAVID